MQWQETQSSIPMKNWLFISPIILCSTNWALCKDSIILLHVHIHIHIYIYIYVFSVTSVKENLEMVFNGYIGFISSKYLSNNVVTRVAVSTLKQIRCSKEVERKNYSPFEPSLLAISLSLLLEKYLL